MPTGYCQQEDKMAGFRAGQLCTASGDLPACKFSKDVAKYLTLYKPFTLIPQAIICIKNQCQ